ncbi:hypothetical protein H5410_021853 [Solanum commersonii]|uniref:AIPP2-like SPOC-like domain-containing protein n=1 Tax=Solanum commersonii TaxID=4109 RepID=A0A9J5ZGG8_SOLCO|nr:hypothetical protein H5410_021853 [Solanum commersonii]
MSSVPSEDQCRPENPCMHHKKDVVLDKREKKICEICGDLGIQEAIITCYQCKNVDVHQYYVLGYWEDALVDWCCEECDICKGGSKLHASTKICLSTVQPKKHSKFPQRQHINWEKEVRTGKMRYLPMEEALGPGASTILAHMTHDVVNESRMMNSPMTHPCDPALAHPPCKVGHKVYEFSKLFPDTIKLELVLHGYIWPSLFDNNYLGKEDIGLFERYITLVEYMHNKDLVMRTLINGVELLILGSTTLMEQRHFLWGLFYRMRQDIDICAEGGSRDSWRK